MMKRVGINHKGFTIVELMIATLVFSVILLIITAGVLGIGKTYYKGSLQARTQNTARNIIDEISRGIQFTAEEVGETKEYRPAGGAYGPSEPYPQSGGRYGICVGSRAYTYILDKKLIENDKNNDDPVDWRRWLITSYKPPLGCDSYGQGTEPSVGLNPVIPPYTIYQGDVDNYKELVPVGMRVLALEVEQVPGLTDSYRVTVAIGAGDAELFDDLIRNDDGTPGSDGVNDTCKPGAGSEYCAVSWLTTIVNQRVQRD